MGEKDQGREYRAFKLGERAPDRLELAQHHNPTRFPAYSGLADIIFDSRAASIITLIYNFAAFHIEGENLTPVVQAIASGNCSRVTLFNPAVHDKPPAGTPIVTKIECAAFSYADKLKEAKPK
jgi:hypothetical protein